MLRSEYLQFKKEIAVYEKLYGGFIPESTNLTPLNKAKFMFPCGTSFTSTDGQDDTVATHNGYGNPKHVLHWVKDGKVYCYGLRSVRCLFDGKHWANIN